jgi:transposase InsO family protein
MDVRALVVAWPEDAGRGEVARFCRVHRVSRSWFYEVRRRAREEPVLAALQPRPRTARTRHRQAVPLAVEELAVRIRKDLAGDGLDHGPVTVRWHLQQLGVAAPATSTLARIFTRRGLVAAQPQKRPRSSYRRFGFGQVHECWQLDAFQWRLADDSRCVVFQLLDDCSRFLIASRVARRETAADAIAVVDHGIAAHQVPCLLLTDNGAAFNQTRRGKTSRLVTHLSGLGCKPITGRPGHPQTQGKDERVHQPLQAWLRAHPTATSLGDLQDLVDAFDQTYNHHRPHQSLAMRTPAPARRRTRRNHRHRRHQQQHRQRLRPPRPTHPMPTARAGQDLLQQRPTQNLAPNPATVHTDLRHQLCPDQPETGHVSGRWTLTSLSDGAKLCHHRQLKFSVTSSTYRTRPAGAPDT